MSMNDMNPEITARAERMRELLSKGRETLVEFLRELGEFDANKSYEAFGYTSIWDYCRRHLSVSSTGRSSGASKPRSCSVDTRRSSDTSSISSSA
jgi:hypothetical protein